MLLATFSLYDQFAKKLLFCSLPVILFTACSDKPVSTTQTNQTVTSSNTAIDFGEGMTYLLDSVDKEAIESLRLYDKALIELGAVDKNYKYTNLDIVAELYKQLAKKEELTRIANGLKTQTQSNTTSILTEFSPYKMEMKFQSSDVMDDTERSFLGAMINSPALLKGLCERVYTPKAFRANNLQMIYNYVDKNNQPIFTQVLNMDTCKGTTPIKNYQPIKQTPDESLSELVVRFDKQIQSHITHATQAEKDSFYYLIAIDVGLPNTQDSKKNLIAKGKTIVDKINQAENNPNLSQKQQGKLINEINTNTYSVESSRIELPNEKKSSNYDTQKLLCDIKTHQGDFKDCLQRIINGRQHWQQVLDNPSNQQIRQRYQDYLTMSPAITLWTENNVKNPLPNYWVLNYGQKLNRLAIIQLADSGESQQALKMGLQELRQLRKHFAKADTEIQKQILLSMTYKQLQTLILIKTRYTDKSNELNFQPITELSSDELDMQNVLLSEYSRTDFLLNNFNPNNDNQIQRYFKLNESRNNNAKIYQRIIKDAQVSPAKLAIRRLNNKELDWDIEGMFSESNKMGWQIVGMIPNSDSYNLRFHHINNYLNGVNHTLTDGRVKLANTFAPRLTGVSKTDSQICYEIPEYDDNKVVVGWSCLYL